MHEPEYMGRSPHILFLFLCLIFVNFTFYSVTSKTYHELFSIPYFFPAIYTFHPMGKTYCIDGKYF